MPHALLIQHSSTVLVDSLLACMSKVSSLFLPSCGRLKRKRVLDWNMHVKETKEKTDFWYCVCIEAGSPHSGTLFQILKNTKSGYKCQIRRVKGKGRAH